MATRELARRKYKKLIDFTTGIKDTTRVHPNWLVSGARTGRWSSSGPNCMQIPQPKFKTENGEKVLVSKGMRDIFCADEGYYLVSADYSQLEVRILALLSGCPIMLRWFTDNIDPHLETAQAIFKTDKITKEMRNQAKTLRYGSAYGGDAETVWKQMVVNFPKLKLEAVDIMMQGMKELHPRVEEYQDQLFKKARQKGYVEMPFSKRRHFLYGKVKATEVKNYPIQGTGAEIINHAAEAIAEETKGTDTAIMFQVHDELTLHTKDPVHAAKILQKHMVQTRTYQGNSMEFTIDFKVGRSWGDTVSADTVQEVEAKLAQVPPLQF